MRNRWIRTALSAAALMLAVLPANAVMAEDAAGVYPSELTNEYISTSLMEQRPVAVMIDNESIALPHYGTAKADVVYEIMNSTANQRVSRLMVLVKDWQSITQLGSIRSTRTTNIPLAAEWNAVLVHDGGPFYVDSFFAKPYAAQHFSGGFTRVDNGKAYEFTEYVTAADLQARFDSTMFPRNYNEFRNEDTTHFNFAGQEERIVLSGSYPGEAMAASEISVPFYHNGSTLRYNDATGTYDYYEYGELHQDAEDGAVMTFTNLLLQCCSFEELDENGYMDYNTVDSGKPGYYVTGGEAVPVTWTKESETDITRFYDASGAELTINTGKTYIALVPEDTWSEVQIG